jgi:dCMP deaminase
MYYTLGDKHYHATIKCPYCERPADLQLDDPQADLFDTADMGDSIKLERQPLDVYYLCSSKTFCGTRINDIELGRLHLGRPRPSWDEYFMDSAERLATRSTCDRLSVGAVLVKENRIVASGYNGSVSGQPHCDDVGHLKNEEGRCIRTIHAEMNVLLDCAKRGVSAEGGTIYVTHEPCEHCSKHLVQAGIKTVIFKEPYPNKYNREFVQGIEFLRYE